MDSGKMAVFIGIHQILNGVLVGYYISSMLASDEHIRYRRFFQYALVMVLMRLLTHFIASNGGLRSICLLIFTVPFVLLGFSGSWKKRVLVLVSTYGLSFCVELLSLEVMFVLFGMPDFGYVLQDSIYLYAGAVFMNMIAFPVHILVITLQKVFLHQIRGREVFFYMTIPVYQFLFSLVFLGTHRELDQTMIYVGTLLLVMNLFLSFLTVFAVDTLIARIQVQEDLSQLYGKRQRELDYYRKVQANLNDLRTMKHDFANQLQTVHALLQAGAGKERIGEFLDSVCAGEKGEACE